MLLVHQGRDALGNVVQSRVGGRVVQPKDKPEPSAEEATAKELVQQAQEQGLSLTGPNGLLRQSA